MDKGFDSLLSLLKRPEWALELFLIALALSLAGFAARALRRGAQDEKPALPVGGMVRLAFPLIAILLLAICGFAVHHSGGHTRLITIAAQLLVALAAVRMAVFALRRAFSHAEWVAGFERSLATFIWAGVALDILGVLPDLIDWLNGFSFHVGKAHVTLWSVIQGAVSVLGTMIVALWVGGIIETRLLRAVSIDSSLRIVFSRISKTVLVMVAVLIGMSLVGLDLTTLSVFGGALGVGLGFGMQKIASNYVSGFIILLDRSISIGNIIQVGQDRGEVTRITTRYTVLRASNGSNILLPNEVLVASTVLNDSYVDPRWRGAVQVQVAYDSDVEKALSILDELASEETRILVEPAPKSNVLALEDSGIRLELSFWVGEVSLTSPDLRSDLYRRMLKRFKEDGIDIPFPQREVRVLASSAG
jgi:small-conductance mechanosensitive channel